MFVSSGNAFVPSGKPLTRAASQRRGARHKNQVCCKLPLGKSRLWNRLLECFSLPPETSFRKAVRCLGLTSSLAITCWCCLHATVVAPALAVNGLVDHPLTQPLRNKYYLVRAGESIADARGMVESNPVDKTSIAKSGLTARGAQQARAAAEQLVKKLGFCQQTSQCWIWPSMTLNAYETGEIIGDKAALGHERIVPEFSYLDKRGLGVYNGSISSDVIPRLHAQDRADAQYRPPAGDDGTPPESIFDVFIRVRQLLSKLETQYGTQGADVVIVAPDTYTLSVLECVMNGEPLERFEQHLFAPGEVHFVANPKVFPIRDETLPHERVNWANIESIRHGSASGG